MVAELKQHERANPGWPTRVAQFRQPAPLSGPGEKVCFPTGHDVLG
ncbi:origin recognition complex subunit Orc5 [Aspergillus luchuensis]|uniref:Origin recognition complex subunit Orc5 n=1 Tax=Aspergillus kawachii TaxID=1069201 RepID=A0A146EZU6_ASPKA|nr:origin recognition complex subunit Orc5 [Aspergillus luchuensis]